MLINCNILPDGPYPAEETISCKIGPDPSHNSVVRNGGVRTRDLHRHKSKHIQADAGLPAHPLGGTKFMRKCDPSLLVAQYWPTFHTWFITMISTKFARALSFFNLLDCMRQRTSLVIAEFGPVQRQFI
ncbi:hypothetical protein B0H17DRAFT_1151328 [Mycena rosella]|uniref:Uncharacterized protein n=1 Tax=Mycena rosella TaxID=1033263 RepID=A0AAD7BLG2_MYCRO|nr:hypothetical protein B0H17DRAFT_1151328 [Mycena rosella]